MTASVYSNVVLCVFCVLFVCIGCSTAVHVRVHTDTDSRARTLSPLLHTNTHIHTRTHPRAHSPVQAHTRFEHGIVDDEHSYAHTHTQSRLKEMGSSNSTSSDSLAHTDTGTQVHTAKANNHAAKHNDRDDIDKHMTLWLSVVEYTSQFLPSNVVLRWDALQVRKRLLVLSHPDNVHMFLRNSTHARTSSKNCVNTHTHTSLKRSINARTIASSDNTNDTHSHTSSVPIHIYNNGVTVHTTGNSSQTSVQTRTHRVNHGTDKCNTGTHQSSNISATDSHTHTRTNMPTARTQPPTHTPHKNPSHTHTHTHAQNIHTQTHTHTHNPNPTNRRKNPIVAAPLIDTKHSQPSNRICTQIKPFELKRFPVALAKQLLRYDKRLALLRFRLVPQKLSEHTFWLRYMTQLIHTVAEHTMTSCTST